MDGLRSFMALLGDDDLWDEHYEKLTDEARRRLPLRSIRFLAPAV